MIILSNNPDQGSIVGRCNEIEARSVGLRDEQSPALLEKMAAVNERQDRPASYSACIDPMKINTRESVLDITSSSSI